MPFRVSAERPLGLPFAKGRGLENLENCPIRIVHIEEAWNPTKWDSVFLAGPVGIWGQFLEMMKLRRHNEPLVQDSVFPGKFTCDRLFEEMFEKIRGVKFISHTFKVDFPKGRMLVEINPGVEMSPSELLDSSKERGIGLVFDPSHLLCSGETISVSGEPTRPHRAELDEFNRYSSQVEVVDINPSLPQDMIDLQSGKGMLKELAQAARQVGDIEFLRVEVPIPPRWQIPGSPFNRKGFELLQAIGQRLMEG